MTRLPHNDLDPAHWPAPLELEWCDGTNYLLLAPFTYVCRCGVVFTAPKNFATDGASIPRGFWPVVFSPTGPELPAGVIHDWLYTVGVPTREQADALFLEMSLTLKDVPVWKAEVMWAGVRCFGASHYHTGGSR